MRVDVRILATTNRDLPAEVGAGRFREDLYFRLERGVAAHPAAARAAAATSPRWPSISRARYAEVNGLPCAPAVAATRALRLAAHAWRGNVRELENTIHRAVLLADGDGDRRRRRSSWRQPARRPRGGRGDGRAAGGVAGLVGRQRWTRSSAT